MVGVSDSTPALYPNEGDDSSRRGRVRRRQLLSGSAAIGATAAAGCVSDDDTDEAPAVTAELTVVVFNTGDGTASLIDVATDEVVGTVSIGLTSSFPSNQFTPRLADGPEAPLWCNVDQGVRALTVGELAETAQVETGSGANWQERTPDGETLVVSAREPAHKQLRISANPDADDFGEVTAEIDRSDEDGRGDNDGPGPCDVTIHPGGDYAYVPDLFGDTLTVIDIDAFEIERQIDVSPTDGVPTQPWMGTAAWDGETLLIENSGRNGSESIWDVSDPTDPVERARLTPDDGLGRGPLTSEIGPDSAYGYVFTADSDDVTVIDLDAGEVVDRLDLGGAAFVGSWDPAIEKLYVPVRSADEVAVIDADSRQIERRIDVGSDPYGATAARVRPADPSSIGAEGLRGQLDELTGEYETTYCIGECACGHEL